MCCAAERNITVLEYPSYSPNISPFTFLFQQAEEDYQWEPLWRRYDKAS